MTKTNKRIQKFLDAHDQHAVRLVYMSKEQIGRNGGYPVGVVLECHNGHDWQGLRAKGGVGEIEGMVNMLLDRLKQYRPDLELI